MVYINSLSLTSFRNYDFTSIDNLENGFIVLIGDNGAGKTNCLEGVSILSPGRGLRGAKTPDYQSTTSSNNKTWAVSASITDNDGDTTTLGIGANPQKPTKKIIRADGDPVKNQQDLGGIVRTVWLTPQMDGLFMQASSERRRFFDRLVSTFDPAHTGRMTRYEKAMRERLTLLKNEHEKGSKADPTWLSALENIMSETGLAIAASRIDILNRLQKTIDSHKMGCFPTPQIELNGDIENALNLQSALSIEDTSRQKFEQMRSSDGMIGRTNFGVSKTDMIVTFKDKNTNASQCSTGEQKALLTTIILAHAHMVASRFNAPPILLFDEISAHFDKTHTYALFDILENLGGQIWMSGQNINAFQSIKQKQLIQIEKNTFSPL